MTIQTLVFKAIELAAPSVQYKKHDRVVVNCGTVRDPEYYLATVKTLRRNGNIHVVFDDEDEGEYKPTRSKAGLVGLATPMYAKRKRKTMIPLDNINQYLQVNIGEGGRPDKPNRVQKKGKVDDDTIPELPMPSYITDFLSEVEENYGKSSTYYKQLTRIVNYYRLTFKEEELKNLPSLTKRQVSLLNTKVMRWARRLNWARDNPRED